MAILFGELRFGVAVVLSEKGGVVFAG